MITRRLRRNVLKPFPYLILFAIDDRNDNTIVIVGIVHGRRDRQG